MQSRRRLQLVFASEDDCETVVMLRLLFARKSSLLLASPIAAHLLLGSVLYYDQTATPFFNAKFPYRRNIDYRRPMNPGKPPRIKSRVERSNLRIQQIRFAA